MMCEKGARSHLTSCHAWGAPTRESHGRRLPVFGNRNRHRERARYEWVSPRDRQDDFNNSELYGANPLSRESDSLSEVSSSGRSLQPTASNAKTQPLFGDHVCLAAPSDLPSAIVAVYL